jgi:formate-dependent nitrite reductase membrane component NrfD
MSPEPRSYYGEPVLVEPVWTWEIPVYFFSGGLAGASAGLGLAAELHGNEELARRAWTVALGGLALSPALLVSDLGVPRRFLNMLRLFKVTSPMSVGSWMLAATGGAVSIAAAGELLGLFPRASRVAKVAAGVLGMPLSTYTATLISNTAVPVWHEARRELPFLFGAGAAASAGAAAAIVTGPRHAAPARRLAVGGAVVELVTAWIMEHRLGPLAEAYHADAPHRFSRMANVLTATGAALVSTAGRRRAPAVVGGALTLAGALSERWAVFKAGFASAGDPKYTVSPQRERLDRRKARAAA